jgi:anti-sigma factor ChrR (cupin superfamily)
MPLNPDFSNRATVTMDGHRWLPSPQAGVARMTLNRVGGEQSRATGLARYAPPLRLPAHAHADGEETLVFPGTCPHDSGHGGYLRHPPDDDSERRAVASEATRCPKTGHLAGLLT